MRIKLFYLSLLATVLFSCSKDNDGDSPKSKTELLSSKTWVYNEYFTNYNQASTILQYKKGKSNNLLDLTTDIINFKADGTFSRIGDGGQPRSGTWQFLNNETQISTIEGGVTHTSNIIVLTENMFTWHDVPFGNYAEMIPK
jgi:hypothetical protein